MLVMHLPKHDKHFAERAPKGFYQRGNLLMALAFCSDYRTAVDVGAHVGYLANDMAALFNTVFAFEPEQQNFKCLMQNARSNVNCKNIAVGEKKGQGELTNPCLSNSGAWELSVGNGSTPINALDEFGLTDVDFVKIDTQGSEIAILNGARSLLSENNPVLLVELGKTNPKEVISAAYKHEYRLFVKLRNDGIFLHKSRVKGMKIC